MYGDTEFLSDNVVIFDASNTSGFGGEANKSTESSMKMATPGDFS